MRPPYRSISSIHTLPSIYTAFPTHYDSNQSTNSSVINSGTCLIRDIEDGLEVVPFERSNALSAPILSPDQEEKEVFMVSEKEMSVGEKPLPTLPKTMWHRMSVRQRILAILGLQFLILMTIGLALIAAKRKSSQSGEEPQVHVAGDDSLNADTVERVQRGIFALPVQLPQQQSSACLAKMNESVTWQCASDATFQMNILPTMADDGNATMITIGPPLSNGSLYHGHQIPDFGPVELQAITNPTVDDGLTYHFRTTYNRVVLLREDDLGPSEKPQAQPQTKHPTFLPGESLWQCNFNESLIEGYVYVNKPTVTDFEAETTNATTTVRLPKVPYVVKLVEQRMPNGNAPYCRKMEVQHDGGLVSRSEEVVLSLIDPEAEAVASTTKTAQNMRFLKRQQDQASNYCRCQWLVQ